MPPLGYDVVEDRYVINEREASVVRTIIDMYASGGSCSVIIETVKKTGVTGKRGQVIAPNTLHFILKNEHHTDAFIWFKWVGKK